MDTLEARFASHVSPEPNTGCWLWDGATDGRYGQFRVGQRREKAHRLAFELWRGAIPAGLTLDHLCRNKACVNPAHLEPVSMRVNAQRGSPHLAKTSCLRGHPLAGANLRVRRGRRICRTCEREDIRARRAANKAAGRPYSERDRTPIVAVGR